MGFLQKGACELGLSMGDLAILRWFTDFKNSGKMITKTLKGDKYYWVSYEAITDEFPILNVKKDAIYRRLRRLCDAEILKKQLYTILAHIHTLHLAKTIQNL